MFQVKNLVFLNTILLNMNGKIKMDGMGFSSTNEISKLGLEVSIESFLKFAMAINNRNHETRLIDMILLCWFNGFARKRICHLIARKNAVLFAEALSAMCKQ